jgi:penicillin-binding protein 2
VIPERGSDYRSRYGLRLGVLRALVVGLLLALLGQLWYLQIASGSSYQRAAAANHVRDVVVPAVRGRILDAAGRPLVDNRTALQITVDRIALSRQPDGGRTVLTRLARLLNVSITDLQRRITLCGAGVRQPCWNGSPYQPIPVAEQVDPALLLAIEERAEYFPGISAELSPQRNYPRPASALAAHLLGYVATISPVALNRLPVAQQATRRNDVVGRAGLELTYDSVLAGRNGFRQVAVDAMGAVTATVGETPPVPGDDLVTSVDARAQAVLERALGVGIAKARGYGEQAKTAAGVVLDARTGHVVAMASYPAYRPEVFTGGITAADYQAVTDPAAGVPLLNRALQGEYSPGSAFKPISVSGVVTEGTANFSDTYSCPSGVTIGNRVFHNFEGTSLGQLDMHTALVKSCDTVFYQFASKDWYSDERRIRRGLQPGEAVQQMARSYGLGRVTGIDLPGESAGLIETRASKLQRWKTSVRDNACAGAKRRPVGDPIRRLDVENCTEGWKFRAGDQANFDIGQGTVLVTPLQLATAYAALVNGGRLFSPRVATAIRNPAGKVIRRIDAPVRARLPISAGLRQDILDALYDVPRAGTAAGAFAGFPLDRVHVGGKTGTAQAGLNPLHDTSWFASFAGPPGQPAQFVTVVTIPKGGQGARAAAPAVRAVWEGLYGIGQPAALPGLLTGRQP